MKSVLNTSEELFAGTGETAQLLRQFDWSRSSLGPVEFWPQSLKTAIRIMLTSRQPIWVGWGPELIYFYNDAYRSIVGGRHPAALGRPVKDAWQEIWTDIEPLLTTALSGTEGIYVEEQLLIMERNGYPEETYYTFSYSPIPDDNNHAGGIICANTDDTQRVINERQLRLLRCLSEAVSVPTSQQAVCQQGLAALQQDPQDIPFAMLYLSEEGGQQAKLAGSVGLDNVEDLLPTLSQDNSPWPVFDCMNSHQLIVISRTETPLAKTAPLGVWKTPASKIAIVPVPLAGKKSRAGALIVGLSPVRLLDENYQSFLDLLAGQLGAAIASANAIEQEKKRAEALAEIDRAKTVFFSNVSHEFRTPLTLMLGPLKEVLTNESFAPTVKQELDVVHRNGLRLLKLVNSLLDFSRVEAGRMQAAFVPVDFAQTATELASHFISAFDRAGIKLTIDCRALDEPVYLDIDMWEKVVFNLLSNAFKYTLQGEVSVTAFQDGQMAVLKVTDSGVGIGERDLPHIFDRFKRVESARGRSHEGTGIGLALVKELVKLHGGNISAQSQLGFGSTFTVTLPLGSAHLPQNDIHEQNEVALVPARADAFVAEALRWLPAANHTQAASITKNNSNTKNISKRPLHRVLLADDNQDMREYIERILKPHYQVTAVVDGKEALESALSEPPDLIVSDVMMPRVDGFALLQELKASPVLKNIPVILLSARAGEEAEIEGIDAGADDYLVKPFSARDLLVRAKALIFKDEWRKEQESHFRIIADNSPAILWTTSPSGSCTYLSKQWYEYTGNAPGSGLEYNWINSVHPDDRQQTRAIFLDANLQQQPFRIDYRLRDASGHYRWVIAAAMPRFDDDNHYLGFVGCVFDISERRQMEAILDGQKLILELGMQNVALPEILSTVAQTLESLSHNDVRACISLFDEKSAQLVHGASPNLPPVFSERINTFRAAANAGACGAAAYSGQPIFIADMATDHRCELLHDILPEVGLHSCMSTPIYADERLLATVALFYGQPKIAPDADDQRIIKIFASTISLVVSKVLDAELRRAADERRRASEAALREADKRKDEFLATLAHELRNPLAPISNALQILELSNDQNAITPMRELVARQVSQLTRLVDDLMDVSRISRGKVELRKAPTCLKPIIESAIEASEPLMIANHQSFNLILPEGDIWLDADAARLSQVVTNLLNNASKYTQQGGHIELAVSTSDREVVIAVKDNGRGIPQEKLRHIFEMFTQIEEPISRSVSGLGLGLTLAEQLIVLHKGAIAAHSEGVGKGSTFTITLPTINAPVTQKPEPQLDVQNPSRELTVFVVDDNKESADSLAEIISLMGHRVSVFYDGSLVLNISDDQTPDVVLLDIGMPGMNGYEVCQALKAKPQFQHATLIAQTGWSDPKAALKNSPKMR